MVELKKYKCHAMSRTSKQCQCNIETEIGFCDTNHSYMQVYTEEQIQKYIENSQICKCCRNMCLIETEHNGDNTYCIICDVKYPVCIGLTRTDVQCTKRCDENKKYCSTNHDKLNYYTEDQLRRTKYCSQCKRRREFNGDPKRCVECVEKYGPTPEKPKSKRQLMLEERATRVTCDAYVRYEKNKNEDGENKCKNKAAIGSKYCLIQHKHWENYSQSDFDRMDICKKCACKEPIYPNYTNYWCDICVSKAGKKCKGLDKNGKLCSRFAFGENFFCEQNHNDMNTYENFDPSEVKRCKNRKCGHYRYPIENLCTKCKPLMDKERELKCIGKSEKGGLCNYYKRNGCKTCRYHTYMENYNEHEINNLKLCKSCPRDKWKYFEGKICDECSSKKKETRCEGLDCNGDKCKFSKINDTNYCDNHKDLIDYTQHMLENQEFCKQGKHYRYCGKKHSTCVQCRKNVRMKREQESIKNSKIPRCITCTERNTKQQNPQKIGEYCKKHYVEFLKNEAEEKGLKMCKKVNRKCRNTLPKGSDIKTCDTCLEKSRLNDKKKRDTKIKDIREERINCDFMSSTCLHCGINKKIWEFLTDKNEYSYYCLECRLKRREHDGNRIIKNTWTNEKHINECIESAKRRKKEWKLPIELAHIILYSKCTYCGHFQTYTNDDGIEYTRISIDRYDNKKGYTIRNSKPACTMCNFMKYTYEFNEFLRYCMNIYENFGSKTLRQLRHYPYSMYKYQAKKNNRSFRITKEEFDDILMFDCYYCDGKNGTNQIGIDRQNSLFGYCTKTNTLVAACSICNKIKNNYDIDIFYNQILKILLFNQKITIDEYLTNLIKKKKTCIESTIEKIRKSMTESNNITHDRRNKKEHISNDMIYIKQIWNAYDTTRIIPELEFCESKDQTDMWLYYRDITSSFDRTNSGGLKILVKDKYSGKYLGLTELSFITTMTANSSCIKSYIGWLDPKIIGSKINNIVNISTCVPLQPFGYNFCGGKLLVKLMFTKEVYEYLLKKYGRHICAIMTYSLKETSSQYSNIPELTYIGKTAGYGSYKFKTEVVDEVKMHLKTFGLNISKNNTYNVSNFCKYVGIDNATYHNEPKGIYFGFVGCNSKELLNNFSPIKHHDTNFKTIQQQFETWYVKYVIPRLNDLTKRMKIKLKSEVNYNEYYVTNKGYHRNRMHNKYQENNNFYTKHKPVTIKLMLTYWYKNRNLPMANVVEIIKKEGIDVDPKFLRSLIMGNTIGEKTAEDKKYIKNQKKGLEILFTKEFESKNKFFDINMLESMCNKKKEEFNKLDFDDKCFRVMIRKSCMYLNSYRAKTSPETGVISFRESNIVLNDLMCGAWRITKDHLVNGKNLFEMIYEDNINNDDDDESEDDDDDDNEYNNIYDSGEKTIFYDEGHFMQYIALYQTKQNDISVNDVSLYYLPHKVSNSGNIFIKGRKTTNCIELVTLRNTKNKITAIKIFDCTTNNSSIIDEHEECNCNFKGIYNSTNITNDTKKIEDDSKKTILKSQKYDKITGKVIVTSSNKNPIKKQDNVKKDIMFVVPRKKKL